jgi:hypothetical protein
MSFIFENLILKISIALILIVVNSYLIHYIAEKLKIKDNSYDNPTTIAIILSIFFLFISFIKMKFVFFLITFFIMIISTKYFYNIEFKEAIKLVLIWLLTLIILSLIIISLLFIFIF